MLIGVGGLLFALLVLSTDNHAAGFAVLCGLVGLLFLFGGIGAKKSPEQLATAQESWDNRWMCARCGNQWEA
jgi:Flp pilus assembly protein protease CpaA